MALNSESPSLGNTNKKSFLIVGSVSNVTQLDIYSRYVITSNFLRSGCKRSRTNISVNLYCHCPVNISNIKCGSSQPCHRPTSSTKTNFVKNRYYSVCNTSCASPSRVQVRQREAPVTLCDCKKRFREHNEKP